MNILLTGAPGCGKSTLVQALIRALPGKRVAGIITPEIREGKRSGFKIVDLASGAEDLLASADLPSGPRVGRYRVNVEGIDRIAGLFLKSLPAAEVVFLDEIGRMELCSEKFREISEGIFECDKIVVAVVHRNLAKQFQDKGELIRVERGKVDRIQRDILERIR